MSQEFSLIPLTDFPKRLFLPLGPLSKTPSKPVFGERSFKGHVAKGELLFQAADKSHPHLYAPTSGLLQGVVSHPWLHPSGLPAPCLILDPDGKDTWTARHPIAWQSLSRPALYQILWFLGVFQADHTLFYDNRFATSNLADSTGFPKNGAILIVHAVAGESDHCSDTWLMEQKATEIIAGVAILAQLFAVTETILVVGDHEPQAQRVLEKDLETALAGKNIRIATVDATYPKAIVPSLVKTLTSRDFAAAQSPNSAPIWCLSAAVAYYTYRALLHGEPPTERLITLNTQRGEVARPGYYQTWLGTPLDWLLQAAGAHYAPLQVLCGGPWSGFLLPKYTDPYEGLEAACHGFPQPISLSSDLFTINEPSSKLTQQACTACGDCSRICPVALDPAVLYALTKNQRIRQAKEFKMLDCIECGACVQVCPSQIPLLRYFRYAKGEIAARLKAQENAALAKARYTFRLERLQQQPNQAQKGGKEPDSRETPTNQASEAIFAHAITDKQKLVAAALAKAKQRLAQQQQTILAKPTENS